MAGGALYAAMRDCVGVLRRGRHVGVNRLQGGPGRSFPEFLAPTVVLGTLALRRICDRGREVSFCFFAFCARVGGSNECL